MSENTTDIYQLDLFYNQHFSEDKIEDFCENISYSIIEKYFLVSTIDNATYEREIFKIIKRLIILHLQSNFGNETEFNVLFSVYLFKKHFKLIFSYLSEHLMQEIAYSNQNVVNFLKYYSLDTLIVEMKKYTIPQIKDVNGLRWNVVSMLSVLKTYIKTQDQLNEIQPKIDALQKSIASFYKNGLSPEEHNAVVEKDYASLNEIIIRNTSRIATIHDSLSILKDETALSLAYQELQDAQNQRLKLREEKALITHSKIKQYTMQEYTNLVKQYDAIQRDIKPKQKIIEQNKSSYLCIKNALIKALISKKQAI